MNPCYSVILAIKLTEKEKKKQIQRGIYVSRSIEQVERKASQFEQCFASTSLLKTQTALPLSPSLPFFFFSYSAFIIFLFYRNILTATCR